LHHKVDFGIVGEIGVAHAKLIKGGDTYEIDIKRWSYRHY